MPLVLFKTNDTKKTLKSPKVDHNYACGAVTITSQSNSSVVSVTSDLVLQQVHHLVASGQRVTMASVHKCQLMKSGLLFCFTQLLFVSTSVVYIIATV